MPGSGRDVNDLASCATSPSMAAKKSEREID